MRSQSAAKRTAASAALFVLGSVVGLACAAPKGGAYTSARQARQAGKDFDIQGEYEGTAGGKKLGVQVIALGDGKFQAVFLPGGLPGAGWDGKNKVLCHGELAGDKAVFTPATGTRKYLAGRAEEFSAAKEFPPAGQKDYTATIADGKLTGKTDAGEAIRAEKVERKAPALGAKPPAGAVVLLAYEPGKAPSMEAWAHPKWDANAEGFVQVTPRSGSNRTKQSFSGRWRMHLEFRTPFQPKARGQGRGNSGVYPPGGREIQVLDSFGLDGLANECGGIYKNHPSSVHMCLPPLAWQTYDVTYSPGGDGQPASYTVVHNGVTIHEKVPLGAARSGALMLQDHGNPVAYRNIWFVVDEAGK